jgi:hypothetical protein
MKKYIHQLIEELHKATYNVRPPSEIWDSVDLDDEGEVEDMAYAEQFIYGTPQKLSEIIGIEKIKFPPDRKLTDEQVELLASEVIRLLNFFNFNPLFPENVPARTKYRLLLEKWDSEQVAVSFGEVEIEFCDYDDSNCPFTGYCSSCEEVREEKRMSDASPHKKLPPIGDLLPSKERVESFIIWKRKEKIKDIIKNHDYSNYIPGIYNYCDRWCERCEFTSRCSNFSINIEIEKDKGNSDLSNSNFWKELSEIFQANIELIREMEKELEIDIDEDCDIDFESENDEAGLGSHPLMVVSKDYSIKVVNWLEDHLEFFTDFSSAPSGKPNDYKSRLKDAIEVIQWYSIFISAKIHRALSGIKDKYEEKELVNDMDGSAKIALIAIERSISAFEIVYQSLQDMEDESLYFLSMLSKINTQVQKTFPSAKKFKRPGFDEKQAS